MPKAALKALRHEDKNAVHDMKPVIDGFLYVGSQQATSPAPLVPHPCALPPPRPLGAEPPSRRLESRMSLTVANGPLPPVGRPRV
jgi:hypothetical protein